MSLSLQGLLGLLWQAPAAEILQSFLKEEGINPKATLGQLKPSQLQLVLNGHPEGKWIETKWGFKFQWLGIQNAIVRMAKCSFGEIRASLLPLLHEIECSSCLGSRLNPLARSARLEGHSIATLCKLPIDKASLFIDELSFDPKLKKLLDEVVVQIKGRLKFLLEVGLHYLSLDRKAPSLSNGEAQRIRLARQLGNSLTGVLYVLDEPTIGLHPRDNARLNGALQKLKG